jgi:Domain of unknown function (DUF4145)
MTEETERKTFDVFCDQCNLQTTARVVATHVETKPVNAHQALTDPVDTPYFVTEYAIALCSKCDRVFLVESDFYEIPGEVCAPQGVSVLYPTDRNISTDGMPETASRAYAAAARSYQVGLYEPCVIMCRKCIEALCQELGATKGNLKERLDNLRKSGHIDQKLATWADELRLIGNDAAHDLDIVIEQVDAQNALEFVEAILMYAFSLTRKFEAFKKRRASKSPGKAG